MRSFNFIEQGSLYAHDLVDVWKKIPAEHIATLSITISNNEVYEPHTQFDVFYNGRRLKYMDIRIAEHKFLTIFFDNLFLLSQIEQHQLILQELTDFQGNWADVTTSTGTVDNTISLTSTHSGENCNVGSNTDNNSNVDSTLIRGYMDVENPQLIPANNMTQTKNKDSSDNKTDTTNNTSTINKTTSSNSSKDYINFLNLKIQQFRSEFYSRFGILFTL